MKSKKGNKEGVCIYIATHKKFNFPYLDIYIPLHVGATRKENLGYLKDNTKENISKKNSNYCELTGMYWIWKNSKDSIVGLVHYRRFFYNSVFCPKKSILTKKQIIKILGKKDIIVAQRGYTWHSTVREQYEKYHLKKDLDACLKILKKKYPDYEDSFHKIFEGDSYCPLNMIITKKAIFDEYCKWLFDIMFELENKISMDNRDKYNARVYGFLSERLFNVWLDKNQNYTFIEKPVFNNEQNMLKQKIEYIVKKVIKK